MDIERKERRKRERKMRAKRKSKGRKERGKEDGIYLAVQWQDLCFYSQGAQGQSKIRHAMFGKKKKEGREGGFHFDLYILFLFIMSYFYSIKYCKKCTFLCISLLFYTLFDLIVLGIFPTWISNHVSVTIFVSIVKYNLENSRRKVYCLYPYFCLLCSLSLGSQVFHLLLFSFCLENFSLAALV